MGIWLGLRSVFAKKKKKQKQKTQQHKLWDIFKEK